MVKRGLFIKNGKLFKEITYSMHNKLWVKIAAMWSPDIASRWRYELHKTTTGPVVGSDFTQQWDFKG